MNLKPGIDVSDVVDRNKIDLLMGANLFKDLMKFSTLVTSSDKGACRIESRPLPFEGDHITSRLFLFFEE
jgi:hypothetical protein